MKRIFAQAALFSLLILLLGIMIGIWIDNYRLSSIRESLSSADVNSDDARLLGVYLQRFGESYCNVALEKNLEYNDKIYSEGRDIERKIESNVFTPEVQQEWRRYSLLQTQFWLNSVDLKERCSFNYSTVVYLSRQNSDSTLEEIDSKVQSGILLDLKERCGRQMMLIPITADVNLTVVDAIKGQFNITQYPAVIVDESFVFEGLVSEDTLNELLKC
ncbi:MAG: hypothetical protein HYT70_00115 [Candidatus Aenigmarchaeota archaeon]|nr:hypothetical protein [Candidatus Aenigmarchaeota archaeon]